MRAPLRITSFATLRRMRATAWPSTSTCSGASAKARAAGATGRRPAQVPPATSIRRCAHISMDALVDAVIRDTRDRMADAGRVDWIAQPLPRLYGDPAMVSGSWRS